jgi:lysyl-tRNA synthetase class 2
VPLLAANRGIPHGSLVSARFERLTAICDDKRAVAHDRQMAAITPKPASDFLPTADWSRLRLRAQLLDRVRAFFNERGFLEVETPILSHDVVVDRHLDPFVTLLNADPRQPNLGERLFLQTSPEFAMKRLLAAGGEAIYQITRAFRNGGERGRLHNPEFTIVEWYRTGDGLREGMQLLSDLAEALLARGRAETVSYHQAFERHAQFNPHTAPLEAIAAAAAQREIAVPSGLARDRDGLLNLLLVELVEPHLGRSRPTILFDYPASQAALARVRHDPDPVAERFELYVDGIELANGYHELLDAAVLRQRNAQANSQRLADGKPPLPDDSRLLGAMDAGLPPCTGVALGFDRVVMIAAGANLIDEVIPFPIERA